MKKQFYSQRGQDEYLFSVFFSNKIEGTFVDIGAHDGVSFSNSYFFERELGWSGVCVEPIPEVFAKLKKNRRCVCLQACVNEKNGRVQFTRVSGYGEMLSGISQKIDSQHSARIRETIDIQGGKIHEIQVDAVTATSIIETCALKSVDLLSIDTEGNELAILKSWPFERIKPRIILAENNSGETYNRKFLEPIGYVYVKTLGDEIYHFGRISIMAKIRELVFRARKKLKIKAMFEDKI